MKKVLFIIFGCISLLLGVLGIVLPLLPTTPFLLLSAALFIRSSPKLYSWLLEHRLLGSYIRNYQEKRAIPSRVKYPAIVLLWVSILYSITFVLSDRLWAQILLIAIAIGVTWHLLTYGRGTSPKE